MTTQNRRECRKSDLDMWPLLYWTTDPCRLPSEARHLSGQPVERYDVERGAYGTITVTPKYHRQGYVPAAFDVEDR